MDTVSFIDSLAAAVAPVRQLLDEQLADYGELLPHVLFGDISRWAVQRASSGADPAVLRQLLDLLESAHRDGAPAVRNLIEVSFIENIEDDEALRALLGPGLLTMTRDS